VAVVALGQTALGIASNVPLTVQPVSVPQWFTQVAPQLPPNQVLLTYPTTAYNSQTPLVWQAVDRMGFRMVGSGGPAGTAARAGRDRAGFEVLNEASVAIKPPPAIDVANLGAVRRAIADWGVTMVVVPDRSELPPYLRGHSNAFATALFTAALGVGPREQDHAWVWERVGADPRPLPVSGATFARCTRGGITGSAAARCVLAAATSPSGPPD
jgi:hypothetical protein